MPDTHRAFRCFTLNVTDDYIYKDKNFLKKRHVEPRVHKNNIPEKRHIGHLFKPTSSCLIFALLFENAQNILTSAMQHKLAYKTPPSVSDQL